MRGIHVGLVVVRISALSCLTRRLLRSLDTDILVYIIDSTDEEKHEKALILLENVLIDLSGYIVAARW